MADTFAARFAAARKALGLTQVEAAARLGVDYSRVGQLESPGLKAPSLGKIYEYATALGIDPHELDERLASTRKGRL